LCVVNELYFCLWLQEKVKNKAAIQTGLFFKFLTQNPPLLNSKDNKAMAMQLKRQIAPPRTFPAQ